MNFTTLRFKDCITDIIDNRGRNPDKYYDLEKYPVIDNYLIKNELHPNVENVNRYLSQAQFDSFLRGYVTTDDLLMTLVGNGIGNVSLSPNDKIAIVQNTVGFRLNKDLLDSHFAFYYFRTINSAVRNLDRGASQPSVNRTDVLRLKLQLPDINTQKRIADVLFAYDDLIENNTKRIKLLEQMAENLYKEWFIRRKNENWKLVKLSQFGYSLESGSRPKGGIDSFLQEGCPSLGAEAIGELGEFDFSTAKLIPEDFYKKMKRGLGKDKDILLYKDGAYIGKVTLFMDDFPYKDYAVNEHVFLMRSNNPIYQYYLYFTLALPQYFTQMQNLNRNAAQPGLTGKDIDIIKLYLPDEEIAKKFNATIEPMLHKIFSLAKQNKNLKKQRDLFLPRLMSGKLEV